MRTSPPAPAAVFGQPDQVKGVRRNMARVMADAFPAAALSGRLAKDKRPPFKASADVRTFLAANPAFDFARHPAYSLLDKSSPFALTGVADRQLPGGHERRSACSS
jgi:hypothetical protein